MRDITILHLYNDTLDMTKLTRAETRSDPDEGGLERLGVCVRTEKPKAELPPSAPTASYRDRRREASADPRRGSASAQPRKTEALKASPAPSAVPARGDASDRALKSLTDTQRRIFEALPLDHAVAIDYFTREGFSVGEIMATMTVLEIKGLTVTLPGGLYSRK